MIENSFWRFLMFLGWELVFMLLVIVASGIVSILINRTRELKPRYGFVMGFAMEFVSILFVFVAIWILTGKNYIVLFGTLVLLSASLMLVSELLWLVFGARNVPYLARSIWAVYEFENTVPTVNKLLNLGSLSVFLIFTAYVGYGFFGEAFASADWPKYVFYSTLTFFLGFSWLLQLPKNLFVMTSQNMGEGTRARLFMNQLVFSVSILMIMSLFMWTTNREGQSISLLGEHFVFSPALAYWMVAYLMLVLIIPYLVGHYRARGWMEKLDRDELEIKQSLMKGLTSPSLSMVGQRFEELEHDICGKLEQMDEDKIIQLGLDLAGSTDKERWVQRLAFSDARDRDPRFIHRKNLVELLDELHEYRSEVERVASEEEKKEVLNAYVKSRERQEKGNTDNLRDTKPWILVGLTAIVVALLNPLLSSVGKALVAEIGLVP